MQESILPDLWVLKRGFLMHFIVFSCVWIQDFLWDLVIFFVDASEICPKLQHFVRFKFQVQRASQDKIVTLKCT